MNHVQHTTKRRVGRLSRLAGGAIAALAVLSLAAPAGATSASEQVADQTSRHGANGWITSAMRHMSLEEKVGQLFVTYAYGESATNPSDADKALNQDLYGVDTPAQLVDKYALGGIIYFAWSDSVNNPPQIAGLSNGLQKAAIIGNAHIPLIVTTDQEQGVVTRVGPPATQFPGSMSLGASRKPADAYTAAAITGQELRALGINAAYAPDSDVNVNARNPVIGVRSFGSDPKLVSDMVSAQVKGLQRSSWPHRTVSATAKHFPGHGDTDTDSHTGIPVITHTKEQWEAIDAPPFRAAIKSGIDMIMTAHLEMPALDPSEDPATLSKPILTGLLRDELGYNGVVVTDSLGMEGVRAKYGDDRVPVLALQAGVDMLLMPPDLDLAYNAVLTAVHTGELTEARIDQSVRRILTLKWNRGILTHPFVDPNRIDSVVGTQAHLDAAADLTDRTMTLVKNDADALPLNADDHQSVLVTGWGATTTTTLTDAITARGATAERFYTGIPTDAQIAEGVAKAQAHDVTVVLTQKAWDTGVTDPGAKQQAYVHQLLATGKPVIVVAVRDPYDIAYFTEAPTYVATYSYSPVSMAALARLLYGEIAPIGKLPVMIPTAADPNVELYPFGHGLSW